jgi:hypothetical protein
VQAGGDLNRLKVIGAVVGTKRALLERVREAEQLLSMIAQLSFHERAEVDWGMAGLRSGRHPDNGETGEKGNTANYSWAHELFLLPLPRSVAASNSRQRR